MVVCVLRCYDVYVGVVWVWVGMWAKLLLSVGVQALDKSLTLCLRRDDAEGQAQCHESIAVSRFTHTQAHTHTYQQTHARAHTHARTQTRTHT